MEKSVARQNLEKELEIVSTEIYQGKILRVRSDEFLLQGTPRRFDMVMHPGAVVMIPVSPEGQLILIKQWRRTVGKILLELPAGLLNEGETPLESAQRELQEEIGYRAETLIALGGCFTSPGFCTEYLHFYLAKDLVESSLPHDEDEAIDRCYFSMPELLKMIAQHQIEDMKTILGILRYAMVTSLQR